jgi:hypothetical protein
VDSVPQTGANPFPLYVDTEHTVDVTFPYGIPTFVTQPLDQFKDSGQPFQFGCSVTGIYYGGQWYRNGVGIPGATGLTYSGLCSFDKLGYYKFRALGEGPAWSNEVQLRLVPRVSGGRLAIGIEFSEPIIGPGQYKRPKVYYTDPMDPAFRVLVEPESIWSSASGVFYTIDQAPAGFPLIVGVADGTGMLNANIRIDGALYTVSGQVVVDNDYYWGIDESGLLGVDDSDSPFASIEGGIKRPYQSMEITETGFVTNELPVMGPNKVEFLYPRIVGSQLFDATDFSRNPTYAYGFTWGSKWGGL